MKKKIEPVVVVEGRDDTANLKRFYDVETYETGGSSIDATDLERLKVLQATRGIIVFTDPDYQGERIRKIIMAAVPDAQHAFIERSEGVPASKTKGHSLGVEHADFESLERAFAGISSVAATNPAELLTQADLIDFGLILRADSRRRREFLGMQLRIGYANGKQLLKRLNLFSVSRADVEAAMKNYE